MLCDDLIFFSRVSARRGPAGLCVRMVRTAGGPLAAAVARAACGVILDLHNPGLDLAFSRS